MNSHLTVFLAWGILWLTNWQPITFQFQYITYRCFVSVAHTLVLLFGVSNWRLTKFLLLFYRSENDGYVQETTGDTPPHTGRERSSPGWRSQETPLWKVHNAAALCHLLNLADNDYFTMAFGIKKRLRVVRSRLWIKIMGWEVQQSWMKRLFITMSNTLHTFLQYCDELGAITPPQQGKFHWM